MEQHTLLFTLAQSPALQRHLMPKSKALTSSLMVGQMEAKNQHFQARSPLGLVKLEPKSDPITHEDHSDASTSAFALTPPQNWLSNRPQNRMLSHLPHDVWTRIRPYIGHSLMVQGHVVIEQGQRVEHIFFPTSGLVSQIISAPCGSRVETGLIGREGLFGLAEGLNDTPAVTNSIVQVDGTTCWLPSEIVRAEFKRNGAVQCWLLRYMQWQMAQATQNVLCNRLHSIEERLARWLLAAESRMGASAITVTHQNLAMLLGTLRSPVTIRLGEFEQRGLIECKRGRFFVLDRTGLELMTCHCHTTLQQLEKQHRLNDF